MFRRLNTFTKIIIIIIMLLAPIIALYSYSNHVSTRVVEEQLIQSNLNRLTFFLEQLEGVSEQLWRSAYVTMQNPNALRLRSKQLDARSYEALHWRVLLEYDLSQLSNSLPWNMEMTLFAPDTGMVVSSSSRDDYDLEYFKSHYNRNWTYRTLEGDGPQHSYFVRHITKPFTLESDPAGMDLILEAAIPVRHIAAFLHQFKSGTSGEPILYSPGYEPLVSPNADPNHIAAVVSQLKDMELGLEGHEIADIGHRPYLISYSKAESFGWYLIDFVPLETIMQPIKFNLYLFYLTTALLLLIGVACASIIYRNVQLPIFQLTRGVQYLRRGEYAYRVNERNTDEFSYLFREFNAMSKEIQQLIEKVYFEKVNVREAKLKQLQSQINPHFLYNNFNFIQSMTQMDNKNAVVAFTQHLSHYYRYITRTEISSSNLMEELELVRSYLEIHKMQMSRLIYVIDVPDVLLALQLPRLLLQPIVENAVVHGIENRLGEGIIQIRGEITSDGWLLIVEDNGIGLSNQQILELEQQLNDDSEAAAGCGLRNVHQRLKHTFDPRSGLSFSKASSGGLLVTIRIIGS